MIRKFVPYALLPLALIAVGLASSPWLRAFPSDVISVPLFGAALLSVLIPLILVGIGVRKLYWTALVDLVLFVFFELLVVLRSLGDFDGLYTGIAHGPSQILTFALPLVSPRTLLVAPVALCWLSGAVIGECLARGWQTVLPYVTLLVAFGLSYAGTLRTITNATTGRRVDTVLAGALLLVLLLLRAGQAWVDQDRGAEPAQSAQSDSRLPLRGLGVGAVLSVVIAVAVAGAVQSDPFAGPPTTPNRVPPLNSSDPLSPVAFVAGLRPTDPTSTGSDLFSVRFDRSASRYVSIASVDRYDGTGWTFDRTFRPSGGVIPAETDPSLRPVGRPVAQQYTIANGPMTSAPWMPFLYRASRVNGATIAIDPASGMIVPNGNLSAGTSYTVRSVASGRDLGDAGADPHAALSAPVIDTQLPGDVTDQLDTLVASLATETRTGSGQQLAFLQAVAQYFRSRDSLYDAASTPPAGPSTSASRPAGRTTAKAPRGGKPGARSSSRPAKRSSSRRAGGRFVAPVAAPAGKTTTAPAKRTTPAKRGTPSRPAASSSRPVGDPNSRTGGTGFADVLASIRQYHAATPEQFATLTALIARKVGVPARLVTGFRIAADGAADPTAATVPAGRYSVTSSDAWTWVEVPVTGVGWVVLDPSPDTYAARNNRPSVGTQPSQSAASSSTPAAQLTQGPTQTGDNGNAVAPEVRPPATRGLGAGWIALIVVLGVLVLIALLIGALLLRKWRRARRRRTVGDPRRQLIGAWQETLDVLAEAGLPELEALTSAEVAGAANRRFGGEPAAQTRYVGDAANAAIFGPAGWIGPTEADEAWKAVRVLRRSVRERMSLRERVAARLWYHRTRRPRSVAGPTSWVAAARVRSQDDARSRDRRGGGHRRRGPRRAR